MNNWKLALLYLTIFTSFVSAGQANLDWLGGSMTISDVEHTAGYLAKVGSDSGNDTTANSTDDGIATIPAASEKEDVYVIGGTGSAAATDLGETGTEPSNFSGKWSLTMTDTKTRSLDLALYQTEELVFGRGVLGSSDGSASGEASSEDLGIESMINWLDQPPSALESASQAAASGTAVGDGLKLDLVSFDSIALYRFDLSLNGNLVSGSYSAYGSDGSDWSGNVTGSRTA